MSLFCNQHKNISIDPDVNVVRNKTNVMDTSVKYLYSMSYTQDRLYVGLQNGVPMRAFIKYLNLPTIPSGSRIDCATQQLFITSGTSTANNINAYYANSSWHESTIDWINMPKCTLIKSNIRHNDFKNYTFDMTNVVRGWYNYTIPNHGISIRYSNESINDYNCVYSIDYSDKLKSPLFTITYTTSSSPTVAWPVPSHKKRSDISSPWGYRNYNGGELHYGIDINCGVVNVVAAIDGKVSQMDSASAGKAILITKKNSIFQARYYHLSQRNYATGSNVTVGTVIGKSGNTGQSSGAHLHFQLQWGVTSNDKVYSYNPLPFYHPDDKRSTWTNPNPMFLVGSLPSHTFSVNPIFKYEYTPSDYNSTSTTAWRK